jgi:RTX calcium-binding nonapeptide repeat (4 copies)
MLGLRRHHAVAAMAAVLLMLCAAEQALAASGPTVTSSGTSSLTPASAELTGAVLAQGALLDCKFEWGPTPAYGTIAPCSFGAAAAGESVPVSALVTGLTSGSTYFWRLVATNEVTTTDGYPESFTAPAQAPVEERLPAREETGEAGRSPARGRGAPTRRPHSGSDPNDVGIYVAYCPASHASSAPRAGAAEASHKGWPKDQCLKMDKGGVGPTHTLDGLKNVHNWLLGGYGNDTIFAGNKGDVIWGDYQPAGQSEHEHDRLHGGAGNDWIYSSHGSSEIWTGAGNDHVALIYGHGTVHCNGPGLKVLVMRFLPQNRHWKLIGCNDIKIEPYKA